VNTRRTLGEGKEKTGKILLKKGRGYVEGMWRVCGRYMGDMWRV
jgi:hypothetical protein